VPSILRLLRNYMLSNFFRNATNVGNSSYIIYVLLGYVRDIYMMHNCCVGTNKSKTSRGKKTDHILIIMAAREGLVELMASPLLSLCHVDECIVFSLLVDFRERNQRPVTTRYNANIVF